jgi:hypothetical protein
MHVSIATRGPARLAAAVLAAATLAVLPAAGASASPAPGPAPRTITASGSGQSVATRTFSLRRQAVPRPARRARRAAGRTATPHAAQSLTPSITANFDGLSAASAAGAGSALPAVGVSSATNGSTTLESAANVLTGFDSNGNQVCTTIPVQRLLPGQGQSAVEDPQLEYDNVNGRFILMAPLPEGGDNVATVWVASSDTSDPCGQWHATELTLHGDPFNDGESCLEFPSLGQTTTGVLIGMSDSSLCGGPSASAVFAIPKDALYAHVTLSFPVFDVSVTEGVAAMNTAGNPMLSSAAGYFVLAVPGTAPSGGYTLFRMDGAGGGTPSVTQQASFSLPWTAPSGAGLKTDLTQGQISSAVWDGSRLWFVHSVHQPGGSSAVLRYGFISTATNSLQVALASHSTSSSELTPSIGVGTAPGGTDIVFLNWATVDASQGLPLSPTVATLLWNGGGCPLSRPPTPSCGPAGRPARTRRPRRGPRWRSTRR